MRLPVANSDEGEGGGLSIAEDGVLQLKARQLSRKYESVWPGLLASELGLKYASALQLFDILKRRGQIDAHGNWSAAVIAAERQSPETKAQLGSGKPCLRQPQEMSIVEELREVLPEVCRGSFVAFFLGILLIGLIVAAAIRSH